MNVQDVLYRRSTDKHLLLLCDAEVLVVFLSSQKSVLCLVATADIGESDNLLGMSVCSPQGSQSLAFCLPKYCHNPAESRIRFQTVAQIRLPDLSSFHPHSSVVGPLYIGKGNVWLRIAIG